MSLTIKPAKAYKLIQQGDFDAVLGEECHISPHFIWMEAFAYRSHNEIRQAPLTIYENALTLATALELVRAFLGNRVILISSWWRDKASNVRIDGAKNSYHLTGLAADIVVENVSADHAQRDLHWWPGGLGAYPDFTHLDLRGYRARW